MSSITLMGATLGETGTSAPLDLGSATSLRLTWSFNFGSPENLSGFNIFLDHASSSSGPWVHLCSGPYIYAPGTYRMCCGGADQWVRARWMVVSRTGPSSLCAVACSGEALP